MPTYREDLHLGHKVPTVETDDLTNRCVTEEKLADNSVSTRTMRDKAVTEPKLDDNAVSTRTLDDGAVTTPKIHDEAVTPEKLSPRVKEEVIKPLIQNLEDKHDEDVRRLMDKDEDLQNQIDSFNEHGLSVSNEFGDDPHIGISQKTLTDAINKIWQMFEDITGEVFGGISMAVSPEYFIGEDGCTVHVTASCVDAIGVFERLAFFVNGVKVWPLDVEYAVNVDYVEFDTHIDETSVIKCEAQILGQSYSDQKLITHYSSFWIGGGTSYQDIMDVEHVVPVTDGLRGQFDVTVPEDEHIIIILGEQLRSGFMRADISFGEILFTEEQITVDGKTYYVLTSQDTYQAETYKVFING